MHWFIASLNHRFIDSSINWIIDSLIHSFVDSLIHWFIGSLIHWCSVGSFTQLCTDSFLSFHWHLNHHFHPRWCTSQLQPLRASASQKRSYRALISYSHLLFSKLPPRRGPGTIWFGYKYNSMCIYILYIYTHIIYKYIHILYIYTHILYIYTYYIYTYNITLYIYYYYIYMYTEASSHIQSLSREENTAASPWKAALPRCDDATRPRGTPHRGARWKGSPLQVLERKLRDVVGRWRFNYPLVIEHSHGKWPI